MDSRQPGKQWIHQVHCHDLSWSVLTFIPKSLSDLVSNCISWKCSVLAVDGGWSPWSFCSKTCGRGTQSRYKFCHDPSLADCQGEFLKDVLECNKGSCEIFSYLIYSLKNIRFQVIRRIYYREARERSSLQTILKIILGIGTR